MEKIYLKNYKGFDEQFLSLSEINFFVGENSTGKTSILKLINILSSQEFWFNGEFNNLEVELGYFDEIQNKSSTDSFFRIGMDIEINPKNKIHRRIIFEFKEEKSIPKVSKIKVATDTENIYINMQNSKIEYAKEQLKKEDFEEWVKNLDSTSKFKKLAIPSKDIPVSLAIALIENENVKNNLAKQLSFRTFPLYPNYTWLAPIRAKAKRIYENYKIKFSPEGDHIFSLLKSVYSNSKTIENKNIIKSLHKFGKDSNLYDSIELNNLGDRNSSPFEIDVVYNEMKVKLPNVGQGVSQSLPLIVEILTSKNDCFSIQQPEVHLHPKAQSAFGEVVLKSYLNQRNNFIIETHSDFTINRFRHALSKSKHKAKPKSQILFFEREGCQNRISSIQINSDGTYEKDLPDNYRNFFIDEELMLLEL